MLILKLARIHHLSTLLEENKCSEIDGLSVCDREEIAPRFLLEQAIDRLSQDAKNSFWWSPRLIVVDRSIVGMAGFKSLPKIDGSVEIGYGIVTSQQRKGFATQAVALLLKEAFSRTEIKTIVAHTIPSNIASQRVLEKNQFVKHRSKIDPDDGEVWIWRLSR